MLAEQSGVRELEDFTCDMCEVKGDATATTDCVTVPPVLMLQINRYQHDG
jgi:uncharacterized UBP type Zn finger protein